jgi:hypothetical protein
VPRHVARIIVDYFASRRLVVDYFAYTRVRVPRHVAQLVTRLVVDYFAYAARLGASTSRAACVVAHRQLFRVCRASGCLSTSHDSSCGSSSTTPCVATWSCGHTGSTSATWCVATTCLVATPSLLRVRRVPPQHHLPVASCRPLISTSFSNLVENGSHAPNN